MMGPAVYRGKDTTLKTLETMCNTRAWLNKNVAKSFAKGRNMQHPTILAVVGQRCSVRLHGAKAAVNTWHRLSGPTDYY